ncbi:hypothetical protein NQ318_019798, partial [Aromia moschata]
RAFFVSGDICGDSSCCSQDLEADMSKYNQLLVDKHVKESISKMSSIIDTRAKKFDDIFRGMMNVSKRAFHEMFEHTYGKIYLQHAEVFSDFFAELETYYKKGTIRLSDTIETFFGILYQRMFTVINAQYTFDDKYLECVSEHMSEMKPFGDVPHKLGIQLRRSFVATRTFYKSLMKGADAANNMADVGVEQACYREMTRMRFCGVCRGRARRRRAPRTARESCRAASGTTWSSPASGTISRRRSGCSESNGVSENVNDSSSSADAVDKVGDRLLGTYNIESVVTPLNIKISEAVMIFQENGKEVSQKIYAKCGKPTTLSRTRRRADYEEAARGNADADAKVEPMKMHGKKKHKKVTEPVDNLTVLEKLIGDIKQKIKDTKQFWQHLPYQYCNGLSSATATATAATNATDSPAACWNGTAVGSYDAPTQKPPVGESTVLSEQVYVVQGLTDTLRKAFQGQEVDLADDTEETLAGSGSGSGDGDDFEVDEGGPTRADDGGGIGFREEEEATEPPARTTRRPEVVRASAASSPTLQAALLRYLLPVVLVWFGGAITNLL